MSLGIPPLLNQDYAGVKPLETHNVSREIGCMKRCLSEVHRTESSLFFPHSSETKRVFTLIELCACSLMRVQMGLVALP